jgi:hypothetical protein
MGVSLVYLGRNDDDREMDGMLRFPGTSCQATVGLSLQDSMCPNRPSSSSFVLGTWVLNTHETLPCDSAIVGRHASG